MLHYGMRTSKKSPATPNTAVPSNTNINKENDGFLANQQVKTNEHASTHVSFQDVSYYICQILAIRYEEGEVRVASQV